MARTYAKLVVDAWADDHWTAIDPISKLVYLFLLSQPKMRSCGVIDMAERRWAPRLNISDTLLAAALADLEANDYVAIDRTTDELAVRTFVKHDAGTTSNWKVWIGVWSSLSSVESLRLRHFVADHMPELGRDPRAKPLALDPLPDTNRDPIGCQSGGDQTGGNRLPPETQSIASGNPPPSPQPLTANHHQPANDRSDNTTNPPSVNDLVVEAIRIIVDREFAEALDSEIIGNEPAYRGTIHRRVTNERFVQLTALANADPSLTPGALVHQALGDYEGAMT